MKFCTICGKQANGKGDLCRKCYTEIKKYSKFDADNEEDTRKKERQSWDFLDTSEADRQTNFERFYDNRNSLWN